MAGEAADVAEEVVAAAEVAVEVADEELGLTITVCLVVVVFCIFFFFAPCPRFFLAHHGLSLPGVDPVAPGSSHGLGGDAILQNVWIETRRWPSSCPKHLVKCAVGEAGERKCGGEEAQPVAVG